MIRSFLDKISSIVSDVKSLRQYKTHTKTPICVNLEVFKKTELKNLKEIYEKLKIFQENLKLLIFVDVDKNDVTNPYMLVWRVVNNIDAQRDIFLQTEYIGIDATNKDKKDGYDRQWPDDADCDPVILEDLMKRNLISNNKELLKHYYV